MSNIFFPAKSRKPKKTEMKPTIYTALASGIETHYGIYPRIPIRIEPIPLRAKAATQKDKPLKRLRACSQRDSMKKKQTA
jgi:hypothetical protein